MMAIWWNDLKKLREIMLLFIGVLGIHFMLSLFEVATNHLVVLFFFITMIMILVVSVTNFDYLHDKTKATHIASLPVTKTKLFIIKYSSGLFVIVMPIVIYILMVLLFSIPLMPIVPIFLLILLYYSIASFVGLLTGTAIMHGFLYLVVTVLPFLIYVSLFTMFIVFIKGITDIYFVNSILSYIVPFIRLSTASLSNPLSVQMIVFYSIYSIVVIIAGIFLSRLRDLEYTGNGFVFPILGTIIKSLIVICFSWIITVLLIATNEPLYVVFIHVVVTLLLCILTQLQKNKALNMRFITIQTISIFLLSVFIFGISNRILTNYIPNNVENAIIYLHNYDREIFNNLMDTIEDTQGINEVKDIHQYLITNASDGHNQNQVVIKYQLVNGDTIYRNYYVDTYVYNHVKEIVVENDSLYESYMSLYYNILELLPSQRYVNIHFEGHYGLNQEEIIEFRDILAEELRNYQRREIVNSGNTHYFTMIDTDYNMRGLDVNVEGPLLNAIERFLKNKQKG